MGKPLTLALLFVCFLKARHVDSDSAVGDPGMKQDGLRVAFEAWNFCNEVGQEAPGAISPRAADCFDVSDNNSLEHRVSDRDNSLGVGHPFPGLSEHALNNADLYAVEKEIYLGSLCEAHDAPSPWQFWMIMVKNGNYDTRTNLCPRNGIKTSRYNDTRTFPCFGHGCMNQPTMNRRATEFTDGVMRGSFNGTYDGASFYEVIWEKKMGNKESWKFHHKLATSKKYPWLMLYLRADAVRGYSGGYHYDTRGMLKTLPESPSFKVKLTLEVTKGGGPRSQFYLVDIGGCWKNTGKPCDGDVASDVTRYCEMIVNPEVKALCSARRQRSCPPYHVTPSNEKIFRNDTVRFPYAAYHLYCAPGNAEFLEGEFDTCDPYSNPQPQEILQLLPHEAWEEYGYPTRNGDGWIGDARTWELEVGELSSRLYFYQDPDTVTARRQWTSIDVGTEVYISEKEEIAEWTISNFDVLLKN